MRYVCNMCVPRPDACRSRWSYPCHGDLCIRSSTWKNPLSKWTYRFWLFKDFASAMRLPSWDRTHLVQNKFARLYSLIYLLGLNELCYCETLFKWTMLLWKVFAFEFKIYGATAIESPPPPPEKGQKTSSKNIYKVYISKQSPDGGEKWWEIFKSSPGSDERGLEANIAANIITSPSAI